MLDQVLSESQGVLIVAESDDAREVLQTVLSGHGLCIWTAAEPKRGLEIAHAQHPAVTVLDAETLPEGDCELSEDFREAAREHRGALLVIGSAPHAEPRWAEHDYVSKPYHFAPLIRKIEALATGAAKSRAA